MADQPKKDHSHEENKGLARQLPLTKQLPQGDHLKRFVEQKKKERIANKDQDDRK